MTDRLRIPRRVRVHLEGSQAASARTEPAYQLVRRILDTKADKRGAVTVDVTQDDLDVLGDYVEVFIVGAQDNVGNGGEDGIDALADVNSGRACLRAINRLTADYQLRREA